MKCPECFNTFMGYYIVVRENCKEIFFCSDICFTKYFTKGGSVTFKCIHCGQYKNSFFRFRKEGYTCSRQCDNTFLENQKLINEGR